MFSAAARGASGMALYASAGPGGAQGPQQLSYATRTATGVARMSARGVGVAGPGAAAVVGGACQPLPPAAASSSSSGASSACGSPERLQQSASQMPLRESCSQARIVDHPVSTSHIGLFEKVVAQMTKDREQYSEQLKSVMEKVSSQNAFYEANRKELIEKQRATQARLDKALEELERAKHAEQCATDGKMDMAQELEARRQAYWAELGALKKHTADIATQLEGAMTIVKEAPREKAEESRDRRERETQFVDKIDAMWAAVNESRAVVDTFAAKNQMLSEEKVRLEQALSDANAAVDRLMGQVESSKARESELTLYSKCAGIKAPTGESVVIVFSDVEGSTELWETFPDAMQLALDQQFRILRSKLVEYDGYEVKTQGDSMMAAFVSPEKAVEWCVAVQEAVLNAEWPPGILSSPHCAHEVTPDGIILFNGLRLRMGVHYGPAACKFDRTIGRFDYFGTTVNTAARITSIASGGQILLSSCTWEMAEHSLDYMVHQTDLGEKHLKGLQSPISVVQVLPSLLQDRKFSSDNSLKRTLSQLLCLKEVEVVPKENDLRFGPVANAQTDRAKGVPAPVQAQARGNDTPATELNRDQDHVKELKLAIVEKDNQIEELQHKYTEAAAQVIEYQTDLQKVRLEFSDVKQKLDETSTCLSSIAAQKKDLERQKKEMERILSQSKKRELAPRAEELRPSSSARSKLQTPSSLGRCGQPDRPPSSHVLQAPPSVSLPAAVDQDLSAQSTAAPGDLVKQEEMPAEVPQLAVPDTLSKSMSDDEIDTRIETMKLPSLDDYSEPLPPVRHDILSVATHDTVTTSSFKILEQPKRPSFSRPGTAPETRVKLAELSKALDKEREEKSVVIAERNALLARLATLIGQNKQLKQMVTEAVSKGLDLSCPTDDRPEPETPKEQQPAETTAAPEKEKTVTICQDFVAEDTEAKPRRDKRAHNEQPGPAEASSRPLTELSRSACEPVEDHYSSWHQPADQHGHHMHRGAKSHHSDDDDDVVVIADTDSHDSQKRHEPLWMRPRTRSQPAGVCTKEEPLYVVPVMDRAPVLIRLPQLPSRQRMLPASPVKPLRYAKFQSAGVTLPKSTTQETQLSMSLENSL
eukprot:m51a1_g9669 putative adenylate cyclase (1101) ;mRNA; f:1239094-1243224